ncbi:hypothetical protein NQ314_018781 [Rhamnusium bicolor]|uniref:DDE Tnp4 domain-containing protein n=1 Tax=Rhamnusium bicolor TaxID=1586634 RepID=A0AAV8WPG3_9CUCU|nr:hypothetical protein NQ314_018781 [Rhamnusium bicolor]
MFRNRKGFSSFNVQAICDHNLKVQDTVCRWPGLSRDSTLFNNSRLLGIRLDVHKVEAIVVACAVLHNIECQANEPELEVDQNVQDAIQVSNSLNLDDPPDIHIGFNLNNVARYNLITQYFQGLL